MAFGLEVHWAYSGLALVAAICIQVATNLMNDAIDFAKGADTQERLGPQRVTQTGLLSHRVVMCGGIIFLILAVVAGWPLVVRGGVAILYIGLPSLFLAYAYTGGPYPLAYRGLGDVFVFIFFGLIAVAGVFYLHTLEWGVAAFVAGAQVGLLSTVLIAINNMRDVDQDKLVSKKTLAVRFGIDFVRYEILGLIGFSFLLNVYWWLMGKPLAAILPLLMVPLAWHLAQRVRFIEPSAQMNHLLAKSAALHLGFGVLLSVGLAL
jgi:1,4-dihydroxy-2-naphthoate polyprenyltransferase